MEISNRKIKASILNMLMPIVTMGIILFLLVTIGLYYRGQITTAQEKVVGGAENIATDLRAEFQVSLSATEFLANSFATLEGKRPQVNALLQVVLLQNNSFEGVYSIWEPNEFDQMDTAYVGLEGHDETGRFMPYWTRDEFGGVTLQASLDYETSVIGEYYVVPKRTLKKAIIDPFIYTSRGKDVHMVATVSPIKYGRNFYGVTGVNIKLSTLQAMVIKQQHLNSKASVQLLSNNGTYVVATDDYTLLGKNITEIVDDSDDLMNEIVKTESRSFFKGTSIVAYVPVQLKGLYTPWQVRVEISLFDVIDLEESFRFWMILIVVTLLLVFISTYIFSYVRKTLRPIDTLIEESSSIAKGSLRINTLNSRAEVKTIFENWEQRLHKETTWSKVLGQIASGGSIDTIEELGHLDVVTSNLNAAVLKLQTREAKDLEKLQLAEEQEWVRNGIGNINNVLRYHFKSFDELAEKVIRVVVDYLNINQGGIFVLMEKEKRKSVLELKSAYAYSKMKALKKEINFGDGIVGTCALEREITYLTEIPEDYPYITSGIGEALPKAVLAAPLMHENVVYGVIELASFSEFSQKKIELIKYLIEPIAAAIASVKINAQTQRLLAELRVQQDEMVDQEKEMRQSLDQLKETQERANLTESRLRRELEAARLEVIRLKTAINVDIH